MNTDKINILLCAIEMGSLTAVAEKLNYSTSGVSRAIEALETEFGIQLLERSKNGVTPTALCELLIPDMKRLQLEESVLKDHARQLANGQSGIIRIGTAYPVLYPKLTDYMATFKRSNPGVQYEVKSGYSSSLLQQIQEGSLDICIVSRHEWEGRWIPLFDDPLVAILPPNHRYAGYESVPIEVYSQDPYVDVDVSIETDNVLMFREHGIVPPQNITTDDSTAMYSMVEAGFGIALNNRINTLNYQGNVVILPLEPEKQITIGIACSDRSLPVTDEFVEYLVQKNNSDAVILSAKG